MTTSSNYNPGREQVQVTAAPNLQSEKARFDPNGSVDQLLEALGSASTQRELQDFQQRNADDTLRQQQVKFDWYVEQFQQDRDSGAVSQAQVKSRFPETVPIIASRIAEAVGQQQGKKQFQAAIEEIAGNDALRLDTAARGQFLAKKRSEMVASVGAGNEFYGAGVVASVDKLINQHEANWQAETGAYHQKIQGDQFSGQVVEAFNGGDAQSLIELDAKFAVSSSLNALERNKIVVASAIDLAFINDDADVLKAVPIRFLNADAKASLAKAGVQLTDRRMASYRSARALIQDRREEEERAGRVAVIEAHSKGTPLDPAQFRSSPTLYAFANAQREQGRLPEAQSAASVQAYETQIWNQAAQSGGPTIQQYTDAIVAHPGINPKDKAPLIARLEKLVEGTQVMRDELVRQTFSDRIGPSIHAMEQSPAFGILTRAGRNLRSEVTKGFDLDLRRLWQAEFEETLAKTGTGSYPTGHRKQELVDQATDRAEARIVKAMDTRSAVAEAKAARSGTAAPSPAAAPAPPAAAPAIPSAAKSQSPIQAAIAAELAKRASVAVPK